jgi:phosphatidylinositol alpha-1,6-mannosyltransferase
VLLFAAPYFPPVYYGGVVQVYLGLLQRLPGYRIVVVADRHGLRDEDATGWDEIARRDFGFEVRRIDAFEFHLRHAAGKRRGLRDLPLVGLLVQLYGFFQRGRSEWDALVRELQPDLIVCGGTYSAAWLAMRHSEGTPMVNYLHGEELTMQVRPAVLMHWMRWVQMRSLRSAALNIAVSDYTASLSCELSGCDPHKMKLLANFVDTRRFRVPEDRTALRRVIGWEDKCVILTLARLDPRKGIDQALRALAHLHTANGLPENWIYVIAGRGKEQGNLVRLAKELGIEDRVDFRGFVEDDAVAGLYQAADLFLQPNREIDGDTEGFGVVFLEANACGLPVIGGTAGGTAAAIEDGITGLRCDGDSVESIAAAVHKLCTDSELRSRMGRAGAKRAVEEFTVEQAAKRFEAMLKGLLEDRGKLQLAPAADALSHS